MPRKQRVNEAGRAVDNARQKQYEEAHKGEEAFEAAKKLKQDVSIYIQLSIKYKSYYNKTKIGVEFILLILTE